MTKKLAVIIASCLVVVVIIIISVISSANYSKGGTVATTLSKTETGEKVCALLQASSDLYSKTPYEDFFDDSLEGLMAVKNLNKEETAQAEVVLTKGIENMKASSGDFANTFDAVLKLGLTKDEIKAYGTNCKTTNVQPGTNPGSFGKSWRETAWASESRACKMSVFAQDFGFFTGTVGPFLVGAIGSSTFCKYLW